MLEREFKYYLDNQEELLKKYSGRVIVIVGESVIGDYANEVEAYTETIKKHKVGAFLLQLCVPGKDSYTQTFHSRAIFA
jgi:hypothetical protein